MDCRSALVDQTGHQDTAARGEVELQVPCLRCDCVSTGVLFNPLTAKRCHLCPPAGLWKSVLPSGQIPCTSLKKEVNTHKLLSQVRPFLSCGLVRVTVHVTMWRGQLLAATRNNVITSTLRRAGLVERFSRANLETINSKSTGVMDIRVRRLLLAAAESDATVESGHVFPLRRRRPTPPGLVRMTSWPPMLLCGRWPPLRPRFCTTT